MKQRISVLTLGVLDLERSLRFCRDGLGLTAEGIIGTEFEGDAVVFFPLPHGQILALFPTHELARDGGVAIEAGGSPRCSIGHLVAAKEEVEAVIEEARAAGATITDGPRDRVWGGYSGYFQDLDYHLREIVWNPQIPVVEDEQDTAVRPAGSPHRNQCQLRGRNRH